jgi:hypothetical protein
VDCFACARNDGLQELAGCEPQIFIFKCEGSHTGVVRAELMHSAKPTMEASMHGSLDRSGETVKNLYDRWGMGIFLLPGLLLAFVIGLLITQPDIPLWISEAAQAEFANSNPPEVAPSVIAQPTNAEATKEARALAAH